MSLAAMGSERAITNASLAKSLPTCLSDDSLIACNLSYGSMLVTPMPVDE